MPNQRPSKNLGDIVRQFGGALLDNGQRALIPGPGHSRKDRSVSLRRLPDGRILIHCFSPRDDWRAVQTMLRAGGADIDASDAPFDASAPAPESLSSSQKIARAHALWAEALPLPGTPAKTYLRARGVRLAQWPSSLRFLARATSLDDRRRRPALIAAITDLEGALQGVHITLLSPCGQRKALVQTPRRVVGKLSDGAVRLSDSDVTRQWIVAEGLETALSASDALALPAWSALNAGNLARFTPPNGLTRLLIAADRGLTGESAAATLAQRMAAQGLATEILYAPCGDQDWNDWARRTP